MCAFSQCMYIVGIPHTMKFMKPTGSDEVHGYPLLVWIDSVEYNNIWLN